MEMVSEMSAGGWVAVVMVVVFIAWRVKESKKNSTGLFGGNSKSGDSDKK